MSQYVLSERDYRRFQELLRWYERVKRLHPPQPHRRGKTGGGGGGTIHKAYCKADAGAAATIVAYLDTDVNSVTWVVDTAYTLASYVEGTNDKTYHCILDHSSTINDKPITGGNWTNYWEISQIEVSCSIAGGGNLDAAIPRLSDGDLILVSQVSGTWYCTTIFQAINNTSELKIVSGKLATGLDECP